MVMYPNEVYIKTVKLAKGEGKARPLGEKLHKVIKDQESEESLTIIRSDSCPKNSGHIGGVQAIVEEKLGRPLQRVLCLKHGIEVVWHRFFKKVDGKTSGPTTLTGPIGKLISNEHYCRDPIVDYTKVESKNMPKFSKAVVDKLSKDQQYLYRIVWAVIEGNGYF